MLFVNIQRQRESIINQTNPSNAYDEEDMTSKRVSYTREQKLAAVGMAQTSYVTLEDGSRKLASRYSIAQRLGITPTMLSN